MRNKRIIGYVLLLSIFLSLAAFTPVFAENNTEITSGVCGDETTWNFDKEKGVLTIAGTGSMYEYLSWTNNGWSDDKRPWKDYCGDIKTIIIEDGVTEVAECSFTNCQNIEKVKLAASVVDTGNMFIDIGGRLSKLKTAGPIGGDYDIEFGWTESFPSLAFVGCDSLESVIIPEGFINTGEQAFANCINLKNISLPDTLMRIDMGAFIDCKNLTEVILPDNIKSIGNIAFDRCKKLETINIPDELDNIGIATFRFCESLKTINLPKNLKIIEGLFEGCKSIDNIVIPETVTEIGTDSFRECKNLTEIIIPQNVEKIGRGAFEGCVNLEHVVYQNEIAENMQIAGYAFDYCPKLVTAGPIGGDYNFEFAWKDKIPNGAFNVFGYSGLTSIDIPEGISTIGSSAFYNCDTLSSIKLPESITKIENSAFSDCENLKEIYFTGDAPDIGYGSFLKVVATAYYPAHKHSWEPYILGNYGGNITWVPGIDTEGGANPKKFGIKIKIGQNILTSDVNFLMGDGYYRSGAVFNSVEITQEDIMKEEIYLEIVNVYLGPVRNCKLIIKSDSNNIIFDNESLYTDSYGKAVLSVNEVKDGNYTINITWVGGDEITIPIKVKKSINVNNNTSSGSSGSSGGFSGTYNYPVKVDSTGDATVTFDKNYAVSGDKVTITVQPKSGKAVDEVIVTDKNNNVIAVTKVGDNQYSFTMPEGEVKVSVTTKAATYDKRIVLQIDNRNVLVNQNTLRNDVAPVIVDNRTMVPIRLIAEILDCNVQWNDGARTITIKTNDTTLNLTIGKTIDGFDAAPIIINDRTYVPIRYVAEKLDANVEWIADNEQIIITK